MQFHRQMDPPSTSQEVMDLFLLSSPQKQETFEKEGNQKGVLSTLTHKYQMQSFSQLSEWCPQITITYLFWADYSKALYSTDIHKIFISVLEVCSILTSSTTSFAFLLARILQNLENIL